MLLTTPRNIRILQRKLYIKAKQEPSYRFYALHDKIYRADILKWAWCLVKANKGSPGIDGIDFAAIENGEGVDCYLSEISSQLKDKSYRTSPVKRVMIPKADGSMRPLGIPTIRDRVVQMATKLVIEPIFEADFCDNSFGFRPKKSAHQAIDAIAQALWQGKTQVIDADLSKYFDTIPHVNLMAMIAERIVDGAVLALIQQWLKAPVIGKSENGKAATVGGGKGNRRGTPQGGVISPLLSNLYLHILDRIWQRHELGKKLQATLVRYADDFVVLCRGDTQKPLDYIKWILERLELTLNETKTKIVDAKETSFRFLGFDLQMNVSEKKGTLYPYIEASEKAVEKIKARLSELTDRTQTWRPIEDVVRDVNQVLRGWSGYFHYRNSSRQFRKVKRHSEDRLRIHLRKRHKISDWETSMLRFPRRVLYEKYGLYPLATKAGWKSAHA
ncbi:MAG: group II intron reverse transcriptase/maturase [Rhodocyclaceae bacterium]|nr:group II intron reverse transcriptase/maturase [Rhodocyclaceae bacterium]